MEEIIAQLKELNRKLDIVVDHIKKPESRFVNALTIAGAGVGALGIN